MAIRGANIVDSTKVPVFPGKLFNFKWEGHGLELYIPEGSLDPDTPPSTLSILATVSGHYQLPDQTDLVSGVYWISPSLKFSQAHSATLKLQHCANIEHADELDSLVFVTAKCSQKTLPYNFKEIPGGVFSIDDSEGRVELTHFSGFGIGRKKSRRRNKKFYAVRTYYIPQGTNDWLTHVVIVWNVDTYLKVSFGLIVEHCVL